MNEGELYATIGEDGFERLCAGFYARVRKDDLLAPMYPEHDWAGAQARLTDFLVGRFGGPPRYVEQRGHPRLRMRHGPFPIDRAARDRWIALMEAALSEAQLPADAEQLLRSFFGQVATFLQNR